MNPARKKKKGKKKQSRWMKIRKRLFRRNKEHLGLKSIYNLFWVHPWLRLTSKASFMEDESPAFPQWVEQLGQRGNKKALLLGNAPCLSELSPEMFSKIEADGYLTIGLNRSIYEFQTDIVLWSDLLTVDDILRRRAVKSRRTTLLHTRLERDHRLPTKKDPVFQGVHKYWTAHRNFADWEKDKLFMFRNGLVAALHLCYKLGIREVLMVGFGFDDRGYFYKADKKYKDAEKYEQLDRGNLDMNFGGYDTHKIVREVLEYLTGDEKFTIRYNGDSQFLKTVAGMENIDLPAYVNAPGTSG